MTFHASNFASFPMGRRRLRRDNFTRANLVKCSADGYMTLVTDVRAGETGSGATGEFVRAGVSLDQFRWSWQIENGGL
jgi:hypothetical protein